MGLDKYWTHCINKLLDMLNLFILTNDCLLCLLACCFLANPYHPISLCGTPFLPCPNDGQLCSYCNGCLASQFTKVVNTGVQPVFFNESAFQQHPASNQLMCGWKAANKAQALPYQKSCTLAFSYKDFGLLLHPFYRSWWNKETYYCTCTTSYR